MINQVRFGFPFPIFFVCVFFVVFFVVGKVTRVVCVFVFVGAEKPSIEYMCSGVGGLFIDGHAMIGTGFISDVIRFGKLVVVEIIGACHSTGTNTQLPFSIGFVKEKGYMSLQQNADDSKENGDQGGTFEFILPLKLIDYDVNLDVCRLFGVCDAKCINYRYVFDLKNTVVKGLRKGDNVTVFEFAQTSENDTVGISKNFDGEIKVSRGTISGLRAYGDSTAITTNAIINDGYSGGPAINDNFEFVGINVRGVVSQTKVEFNIQSWASIVCVLTYWKTHSQPDESLAKKLKEKLEKRRKEFLKEDEDVTAKMETNPYKHNATWYG